MKKVLYLLGSISVYVCALWVFLDGLFLLALVFGWERGLGPAGELVSMDPNGWTIRGLALLAAVPAILFPALVVLRGLDGSSPEDQICLDNPRGQVRVSTRTISDYLQKKSALLEGVDSVRIRVNAGEGGKVSLQVEASVYAEEPLPVVTQRIQDHIEKELKGTIGVEAVEGVHIRFRRIGDFRTAALPAPKPEKTESSEHQESASS